MVSTTEISSNTVVLNLEACAHRIKTNTQSLGVQLKKSLEFYWLIGLDVSRAKKILARNKTRPIGFVEWTKQHSLGGSVEFYRQCEHIYKRYQGAKGQMALPRANNWTELRRNAGLIADNRQQTATGKTTANVGKKKRKSARTKNQQSGEKNLLGNTWIAPPQQTPTDDDDDETDELFAIIYQLSCAVQQIESELSEKIGRTSKEDVSAALDDIERAVCEAHQNLIAAN